MKSIRILKQTLSTTPVTRNKVTLASESATRLKHAQLFMEHIKISSDGKFDSHVTLPVPSNVKDDSVLFRFTVNEPQLNANNHLHGSYIAYLVDLTTTAANVVCSADNSCQEIDSATPSCSWVSANRGVSVELSVTYISSAQPGDKLAVRASRIKTGKNLSFLEALIWNVDSGASIASGKHTKFVGR